MQSFKDIKHDIKQDTFDQVPFVLLRQDFCEGSAHLGIFLVPSSLFPYYSSKAHEHFIFISFTFIFLVFIDIHSHVHIPFDIHIHINMHIHMHIHIDIHIKVKHVQYLGTVSDRLSKQQTYVSAQSGSKFDILEQLQMRAAVQQRITFSSSAQNCGAS